MAMLTYPLGRVSGRCWTSLELRPGIRDLSDLLVVLVRTYRDYTSAISKIQELLTSITSKIPTSSTSKAVATGEVTSSKGNPGVSASEDYEWCQPKSSIKNLEGFVKYLERSLGLIDWWDEGDKYCFKTRRKPAKTE
jgi:hypothetical protein